MKKILSFLLVAAMLVSMFAVTSFAADLTFTVDAVDGVVEEGQTIICTSLSAWAAGNPDWSMNAQLTPSGNGYKVVAVSSCPVEPVNNGDAKDVIESSGFTAQDGDIYVIAHGGGSNSNAWNIKVGMTASISKIAAGEKLTFSGDGVTIIGVSTGINVANNVAYGKDYTTSELYRQGGADVNWAYDKNAAPAYPDNGGELTDGRVANDGDYNNSAWVGLHMTTPDIKEGQGAWVCVDLGAVTDITKTIVYLPVAEGADYVAAGIAAPYAVVVSVSNDGSNWTEAAKLGEDEIKAQNANLSKYVTALAIDTVASARYVKAEMFTGGWAFISEIAVIGAGSSDNGNTDEEPEPEVPVIPDAPTLNTDMGEPNANPDFVAEITVPEYYKAGEEVVVTISINDIKAANGLHIVGLDLFFDNDKLEVVPMEGAEEGSTAVDAMIPLGEWEDMTKYEVTEDGKTIIKVGAGTAGTAAGKFTPAVKDGDLTFKVKFIAKKDATGGIAVWAPHASVYGEYIDGTTGEILKYVGNGDEAVINAYKEPTPDKAPTKDEDKDTPDTGDATAIIFFAIIALVAMAGSAVVVKTRK